MKYQIADLNNGPFGEVFDAIEDAEQELADAITEGDTLNSLHDGEYAERGEEPPRAADFYRIVDAETGEEI